MTQARAHPEASLARAGAGMALGTIVSRATGFVRNVVIATALGSALFADAYNVANTLPNILFILLVGGTLNAVFVPQLARAAARDPDGGVAYTDRLLTVALLALLLVTAAAFAAAPLIVDLYSGFSGAQRDLTVSFARYCLPQIFFYGAFTMLGQVLNARGRFGPMMWTPALNNVVVIGVFGLYLIMAGSAGSAEQLSAGQARLLGLGSTAGIVVQALALLPFLRGVGFRWRPRFDWRGSGLNRTARLAGWIVLVVVVNQVAYWVVTRLSTEASVLAAREGITYGVGYSAYSNAHLLWLLPHSVISVSLLTAALPAMSRAAAAGDLDAVRRDLSSAVRLAATVIVPGAVFFFVLGPYIATAVFLQGRMTVQDTYAIGYMLSAFGLGLIPFSAQYLLVRVFYALDDARTPFFISLWIALVHVALSVTSFLVLPPRWSVTGIAGAYGIAYAAGLWMTSRTLRARLAVPRGERLVPTAAPIVAAAVAGVPAAGAAWASTVLMGDGLAASLVAVAAGGVALAAVYVLVLRRIDQEALASWIVVLRGRRPGREAPPETAGRS